MLGRNDENIRGGGVSAFRAASGAVCAGRWVHA